MSSFSKLDERELREAHKLLAHGRAYVMKKAEYSAPTLLGLVPEFVEGIPTMGVTKQMVLYVNPRWLLNEPEFKDHERTNDKGQKRKVKGIEVLAGALYHEVHHVQRDLARLEVLHEKLKDKLRPFLNVGIDLVNIGADEAINDNLIDAGWELPSWVATPEKYGHPKGKLLEWYVNELLKQPVKKIQARLAAGGGGNIGCGQCGGIGGVGDQSEFERDLDKEIGRTFADVDRIKYETMKKVQQARRQGFSALPGFALEEVEFRKEPKVVPWNQVLQHVTRKATGLIEIGQDDYSYKYPSKRALALGMIRPGFMQQQCEILFIRDTSGSMGDEQLNTANNQIVDVIKTLGYDSVHVVDADTQMHFKPKRVRVSDMPKLKAYGRGGTNFTAVLSELAQTKLKFDVVIYLSDGDGPAPSRAPKGMHVIWCVVPCGWMRRPALWGDLVICSDDPKVRASIHEPYPAYDK